VSASLRLLAERSAADVAARQIVQRLSHRRRARHVARLALELFDMLAPVHGLWPRARVPLALAADILASANAVGGGRLPPTLPGRIVALASGAPPTGAPIAAGDRRAVRWLAGLFAAGGGAGEGRGQTPRDRLHHAPAPTHDRGAPAPGRRRAAAGVGAGSLIVG